MPGTYLQNVVTIVPHYDIGSGRDAVNVTHWEYTGTPLSGTQLTAIQSAFDSAWSGSWINYGCTNYNYLGCWVIDNSSETGGQRTNQAYTPRAGAGGVNAAPDQAAALISIHGFIRYRGGHSRLYIPGASSSMISADGQNLTNPAQGYVLAMWNQTVSAMFSVSGANGGPINPVIWHKKWAAHTNTTEPVASVTVPKLIATQRRRVRKVSRHRTKRPA